MNKMRNKSVAQRAGFTLLEIMLVIVIIGVIAAVAIGNLDVVSTSTNAKRDATKVQIGQVSTAVQRYYMDVGKMPPSLEALKDGGGTKNWKGPYMQKIKEDAWGDKLVYTATGSSFEIKSNAGGTDGGPISSKDL